jgi:hypothetical protein
VNVTAHRRGFLRRAGATIALAVIAGAMIESPAFAAPTIDVSNGNVDLNPGDSKDVTFRLTAGNTAEKGVKFTVDVGGQLNGIVTIATSETGCAVTQGGTNVTCSKIDFDAQEKKDFTFAFTAKNQGLQPGENRNGGATLHIDFGGSKSVGITAHGPAQQQPPTQQQQTVTEVSGSVVNIDTGEGLGGAAVIVSDQGGHEFAVNADGKGAFKVLPAADKPISPGTITIGASKALYTAATQTREGAAGKGVTGVRVSLKLAAAASDAATAPTDPNAGAVPTSSASGGAVADQKTTNASADSGTSFLSWLAIGIGVLLFLAGVGAIVVLVMRRKGDRDEPDDDGYDPQGGPRGPRGAPVPASQGVYHGGPDATRVARGGMNDATAIVRPGQPLDEFPDPYAAPPSAPGYQVGGGTYGAPTQVGGYGYNGQDQGGYGGGYRGGQDQGGGGDRYGAETRYSPAVDPRGGGQRYAEEPTGRFTPSEGGGYPSAGAYPDRGGRDEYNGGNDYGRHGGGGAGYGGPSAGAQPSGGPGYGHEPANGYRPPNGYQDPPPNGRGDRPVNWLDD